LSSLSQLLFTLEPQYVERVWGGQRLRAADPPVGEAWIACGASRVASGQLAGRTLDELSASYGPALLGETVASRFGARFPLLIKLLDSADWLSIQVHPDDEQARRMVGAGEFGKTEAWYFIGAEPGAQIIAGVKPGVGRDELAAAIRQGRVLEIADRLAVHDSQAILVAAGTLHAIGPGILLYEVQEASDTTYRIYDWDRPGSAGRRLNIEESIEVARPLGPEELRHPHVSSETGTVPAIGCSYFDLDLIRLSPAGGPLAADTVGRSCHIVTAIEGAAEITHGTERLGLGRFETALVAGSAGTYQIHPKDGRATLLRAAVPDRV
jgi:mannose-6-phosphate isomerase